MKIFDNFPNFSLDDSIFLTQLYEADITALFEIYSNELISKYLPDDGLVKNEADAANELLYMQSLFQDKQSIFWAIRCNKNLIGTVGLNYIDFKSKTTSISCDLNPEYWKKGIMTKSLSKVINFIFNNIKLDRIEANIMESNERSIKLFTKLNFKEEKLLKAYKAYRGVLLNFICYSLNRRDFLLFKKTYHFSL